MEITSIHFTSAIDRRTYPIASTDPEYATFADRVLHWTPMLRTVYNARRREDVPYHAGYVATIIDETLGLGTYTLYGNTQPCEGFPKACKATADRRVRGYDFCLQCARAFAEYTPDPVHIIE